MAWGDGKVWGQGRGHGQRAVGVTGEGVAGKKVDWDELGNRMGCVSCSHRLGVLGSRACQVK